MDVDVRRQKVIRAIARAEQRARYVDGFNIRDEVTGPIVDELFEPGELVEKTLANGITLAFRYTSKISREFMMAWDETPDHAWEPQTTRVLLHLAKNARNAIVGGAYFGDQAILVANEMRSSGKCHCFDLDNTELLVRNAKQNALSNVVVNALGLWSEDKRRISLAGSQDSHATPREDDAGSFLTTTVDAYGSKCGLDNIDLLMLDIEGGEFAAIKGAERYLSMPAGQAPSVVYEIHRSYVDWSNGIQNTEIVQFLSARGYIQYAIRDYQGNVPMAGRPVELVDLDDIYLDGPPHGFNIVAVKRPELLQGSDFRVRRGVSPKLLFHRNPAIHAPLDD